MSLEVRVRPFRSADVPIVATLIPTQFLDATGQSVEFDGPAACRRLLEDGGMTGALLTTVGNSGEAIIAAGAAVFITDEFAEVQQKTPQPGVAERTLASALWPNSPVLRPAAIERMNERHGLNVAVVLRRWDRANTAPDLESDIRIQLMKAFLNDFRGYRLRELLTEALGEDELQWAINGGFALRNDYDAWYRAQPESAVGPPIPDRG